MPSGPPERSGRTPYIPADSGSDREHSTRGPLPVDPLQHQSTNAAVAGHRTSHGAHVYGLDTLIPGDRIEVTTLQGRFIYRVSHSFVVAPSDTGVLGPSVRPELTLTTCNPKYSSAQRLIVVADLVTQPAPSIRNPGGAGDARVPDPATSPTTWMTLAGAVLALAATYLLVRRVRRWEEGR